MINHALTRPGFHPGCGAGSAVSAFGRSPKGREITEVSVGITQEEGIPDGTAVAPVNLELDKRFSRHSHQRDSFVDENRGNWQLHLRLDGLAISFENLWAKDLDKRLVEFSRV